MRAAEERSPRLPKVTPVTRRIGALPLPSPSMLLPRVAGSPLAFPFGDPRTQFFYLGRAAVWHAMRLLHLRGEEVLVPAYHHGVEIEALVAAGAKPRFYGVDRTMRADLASLAEQLTPATRALYVVHYAGFPQPMDDLLAFARHQGLKVIEDCALSLLSADGMRPLGSRADAAIFCLYKTLPVPHGGALWMPKGFDGAPLEPARLVIQAQQLASGMLARLEREAGATGHRVREVVRGAARRLRGVRPLPTDARPVGNRKFVPGQERLAIAPIALRMVHSIDLAKVVERRRRNYYALMGRLRDVAPPLIQELAPGMSPLFYPTWVEGKPRVHAALIEAGIEAIDFWSEGSALVERGRFPIVDGLRAHLLELPIHQDLEADDLEAIARAVRQAVG